MQLDFCWPLRRPSYRSVVPVVIIVLLIVMKIAPQDAIPLGVGASLGWLLVPRTAVLALRPRAGAR